MLHENIKTIRECRNITQAEFAKKLGVKPPQISRWEKDELGINIHVVAKMAEILDVTIDQLYYGKERSATDSLMQKVKDIEKQLSEVKQAIPTH